MSKKESNVVMGIQALNSKDFDDQRNAAVEQFAKSIPLFRRRLTQSLYWTSLDKDLANQFFRDERWIFGVKFWDVVKLIDHGSEEMMTNSGKGIGFTKK